jgi:hypothetical protein
MTLDYLLTRSTLKQPIFNLVSNIQLIFRILLCIKKKYLIAGLKIYLIFDVSYVFNLLLL